MQFESTILKQGLCTSKEDKSSIKRKVNILHGINNVLSYYKPVFRVASKLHNLHVHVNMTVSILFDKIVLDLKARKM